MALKALIAYLETLAHREVDVPLEVDDRDARERGAPAKLGDQPIERRAGAACLDFDRTIARIADRTVQIESARPIKDEVTKPDALDATADHRAEGRRRVGRLRLGLAFTHGLEIDGPLTRDRQWCIDGHPQTTTNIFVSRVKFNRESGPALAIKSFPGSEIMLSVPLP